MESKRLYQKEWIRERRNKYIEAMGPCYFCGSMENIIIHHVEPDKKESHKIWSWKHERIKRELRKCIPLCASCHTKIHNLANNKNAQHGTLTMYHNYSCRCSACRKARSDYYKKTGQ